MHGFSFKRCFCVWYAHIVFTFPLQGTSVVHAEVYFALDKMDIRDMHGTMSWDMHGTMSW